jgi:hypothetical protein
MTSPEGSNSNRHSNGRHIMSLPAFVREIGWNLKIDPNEDAKTKAARAMELAELYDRHLRDPGAIAIRGAAQVEEISVQE